MASLVSAAPHPIEGAEQIARFFVDVTGRAPNLTILERTVNGHVGCQKWVDMLRVRIRG
jgi:hypothetical protein